MGVREEVGMGVREEVGMGAPEEESPEECTIQSGLIKNCFVAASVGAGVIHLWAAWAHSSITRVLVFFVLVAALQLWLATAVLWVRSVPWALLIGGAAANAAVVVVWVLSRTTGVPWMPNGGRTMDEIMAAAAATPGPSKGFMTHAETFGLFDTTASLLEVVVVVCVVMLVLKRRRGPAGESGTDATVAVGSGVAEDSPTTGSPRG
jgi:hypothetical protein